MTERRGIAASDFEEEVSTATVATSLGPVTVAYRPYALTPAMEMELAEARTDEGFYQLLCEVLVDLGISGPLWSTTDRDADGQRVRLVDDEQPIPIEPAYVAHVPSRFLDLVLRAIQQDMTDGDPKASSGSSRNGSFSRR